MTTERARGQTQERGRENGAAPRTFASLRARPRAVSPDEALAAGCAHKIFTTREGDIVLSYLRAIVEAPVPADVSDGALRMREGERILLRRIEGLIARGEGRKRE